MKKPSRKLAVAALVVALTAPALHSFAATPTFVDSDDFSSNSAYAPFYGQKLTWSKDSCLSSENDNGSGRDTGVECAFMTAPKNWYDAHAGTIKIALARKVGATPDGKRLLLSNPGGPGGSGLFFGAIRVPGMLLNTYDTHYSVGIDPRGVGASTQLVAEDSAESEPDYMSDGEPRTYTTDEVRAAARNYKRSVENWFSQPEFASFAKFVNSDQTARDFNLARAVLGFAQSDFYGMSYGSWLGSIIAKHFPNKFDRVILDGNVDWKYPDWTEVGRTMTQGQQASLDRLVYPFIARHDDVYHLGTTIAQVHRKFEEARAKSASTRRPVRFFDIALTHFNYSVAAPDKAARLVLETLNATPEPSDPGGGQKPKPGPKPKPPSAGPADGVGINMTFGAVACGDIQGTQDFEGWWKKWEANMRNLPLEAGGFAVPTCYGWAQGNALSEELLNKPLKQVLMLQQEGDPATYYTGALNTRLNSRGNIKMVFVDDLGGHSLSYLVSPCANSAIQGYLKGGQFPATDVACQAPPLRLKVDDPITGKETVIADTLSYEFLGKSTPSVPLPRNNAYIMRDLSEPQVDDTPAGRIGGPAALAAEEFTIDQRLIDEMDDLTEHMVDPRILRRR